MHDELFCHGFIQTQIKHKLLLENIRCYVNRKCTALEESWDIFGKCVEILFGTGVTIMDWHQGVGVVLQWVLWVWGWSGTVVIKVMQVIINTIFILFWILISFINDSYTEQNCAKRIRDLHNGVQKTLIRTAHNVNFTLVSFKDCSVIIGFF